MGETRMRARFRTLPTRPAPAKLDLLVDTEAAYSWLPRRFLEELEVKPLEREKR